LLQKRKAAMRDEFSPIAAVQDDLSLKPEARSILLQLLEELAD
jgi:hypothetical protein